jgi:hypothetical protein
MSMHTVELTTDEMIAVAQLIKLRRGMAQSQIDEIDRYDQDIAAGTAPEVLIARRESMVGTYDRCKAEVAEMDALAEKFS